MTFSTIANAARFLSHGETLAAPEPTLFRCIRCSRILQDVKYTPPWPWTKINALPIEGLLADESEGDLSGESECAHGHDGAAVKDRRTGQGVSRASCWWMRRTSIFAEDNCLKPLSKIIRISWSVARFSKGILVGGDCGLGTAIAQPQVNP